jgi:hypothetical protein
MCIRDRLGSDVVVTSGNQTIGGTKTFTNGVRFNDGTTQITAAAGIRSQVFTGSGTFTILTGITALKVTVIGAGGGGGQGVRGSYGAGYGGNGGSGGYSIAWLTGLTPGNTLSVTIGAGGAGGSGTFGNGGAGGTTSVASGTQSITTISVGGGGGGSYGVDGAGAQGAAGATPTGGTINLGGRTSVVYGMSAVPAPTNNSNGNPGLVAQAGGSGGIGDTGTWRNGGAGAPGLVIFEW